MAQLVELKKKADSFSEKNVEIIAVFREEAEGLAGLKKIKERTGVDFTLALDTGAEKTKAYSPGRREFTNYVIGSDGKVSAVIKGDLRKRATSEELMKVIDSLDSNNDK